MPKTTKNTIQQNIAIMEKSAGYQAALAAGYIDHVLAAAANFSRLVAQHPGLVHHREVMTNLALLTTSADVSHLLNCAKQGREPGSQAEVEQIIEPLAGKVPPLKSDVPPLKSNVQPLIQKTPKVR